MFVEVVGGWLTHSLALLSDAMHMLTDCAALTLALLAQRLAAKPRTIERSYGFRRAETIAALLNAVFLCATSVWIAVEAVRRWSAPVPVLGRGMLLIATLGLVVNLLSAWALSTGGHGQNVNTRAAMAHVLSDALGSVAAIAAAAAIVWFGWQRADSLASLGVSVLILWGAWRLLLEATDVLMQSAPRKLNLEKLRATIGETPGVCSIHELHVWQVAEGFSVLTVHVVVDAAFDGVRVTSDVAARVRSAHKITQVTVQPELAVADDVGCVSEVSIATVASSVGASTAALAKG
jgi:cobalt-zinc-cadmium efflux system protein